MDRTSAAASSAASAASTTPTRSRRSNQRKPPPSNNNNTIVHHHQTRTTTTTTTTTSVQAIGGAAAQAAAAAAASPPVISLLDDSFETNEQDVAMVARSSRRSKRKKAPPAAAAAANNTIIDLLDDDEDNNSNDTTMAVVQAASTRKRKRTAAAAAAVASNTTAELVQKVLEVLPTADRGRVETLLQQHNQSVDAVVNQLLFASPSGEEEGQGAAAAAATSGASEDNNAMVAAAAAPAAAAAAASSQPMAVEVKDGSVTSLRRERKTWSHDFMAPSSFLPSDEYLKEAAAQLLHEFPFLSKLGADRILQGPKAGQRHYAIAHDAICKAIQGTQPLESQYQHFQNAMDGFPLMTEQSNVLTDLNPGKNHITRPRRRNSSKMPAAPPAMSDPILVEEVEYVKQKLAEWTETAQKHAQRKRNQTMAKENETAMVCDCCCDSYAVDDMCQCKEGHLYCPGCLENYANAQIFGNSNLGPADKDKKPATQLTCFLHSDCREGFPRAILEKALPRRILEKHDELQSQITIDCAGLANIATCPKCNYKAEMAEDGQTYFKCVMADCQFESCQSCGLKWHGNKMTCDEARQQEHAAGGRHKVEEAMSAAKIRECPKCSKPFLKETGCNKISCGCGALSCYVCRKLISKSEGYAHFCQKPHCQHKDPQKDCGGKCPLWTKDDEKEDAKHVRKAGMDALDGNQVERKVVDQLLRQTPPSSKKRKSRR